MSNYHTSGLQKMNVFLIMGSIYAEVGRTDSALSKNDIEAATQAQKRAIELFDESSKVLSVRNKSQMKEVQAVKKLFVDRFNKNEPSNLDNYFMPFLVAARLRQIK